MKKMLLIAISVIPVVALADDLLPERPNFNRYQVMLNPPRFAVATVAGSSTDFPKDLYIANVARSGDDIFLTLASATDKNFKEYLSTKGPNEHGFFIKDIRWEDKK